MTYTPVEAPELDGTEPWLQYGADPNSVALPSDVGKALVILCLRSMPYEKYLTSYHWKGVRMRTMAIHRSRCVACALAAQEAHHVTYARKGFEWPKDVVAVCAACHRAWHETWRLQLRHSITNS